MVNVRLERTTLGELIDGPHRSCVMKLRISDASAFADMMDEALAGTRWARRAAAIVAVAADDRPIGLCLTYLAGRPAEAGFYVDPHHRRRGVGRLLACAARREIGVLSVDPWCEDAHRFFRTVGLL